VSNVFARQGVLFVALPIVVAEVWGEMTWAEQRLYVCLLLFGHKHTAVELHLPAFIITDYTGLHSETIRIARKRLEKRGYIRCKKGFRGVTIYSILNPISKTKLPPPKIGNQQFSGVYKYESESECGSDRARRDARKASPTFLPPSGEELFGFGPSQLADQTGPKPSQSVSTTKPIRPDVADSLGFCFSEVIENKNLNEVLMPSSQKPMKKGYEEEGAQTNITGNKVGTTRRVVREKKVKGDGVKIAAALAESPVVRRMQEKLGTRIVGIVDYRTAATFGNVGDRGVSFEEWDKRQRMLPKGVRIHQWRSGRRILMREEALLAHGEVAKPTPGPAVHFVEPGEYTPKSDLGQPQRCRTHGITTWWRRPGDTTLICDRCSPNPHDETNWKEQVSQQANRPAMSAARIETIRF